MKLILQLLLNGVVTGALYAMMAIGFGLAYRSTKIFHLAYGGLYIVACYLLYTAKVQYDYPLAVAIPLAIIGTGLVGLAIEKAIYMPFYNRKASTGVLLISSLGIFIVIENVTALYFGNEVKTISAGIQPIVNLAGLIITRIQALQFMTGAVLILLVWIVLQRWTLAKALWAMGDEPDLIPVVGLPIRHLRAVMFIASSVMMAIPACLISIDIGMDPHIGMSYLLIAAVAVFFGGVDNFWGWVIGGLSLALIQSLALWQFSARWMDLVTFTLLVAILLIKPQGLLGTKRRIEEMLS